MPQTQASGSVRYPDSSNAARARRNAAALAEAKAQGFGNTSARGKALKRNWWKADKRNCYVEHASAEPATPLLDRLDGGSGPVKIIMKDGRYV